MGAAWTASGVFGPALSLAGNSFAEAPDSDVLTLPAQATLEADVWIDAAPAETASILNKWAQSIDDEFLLGVTPQLKTYFAWHTTGGDVWGNPSYSSFTGSGTLALNAWNHIALVRDGPSISFYVNGTLDSSSMAMDSNPFRNGSASLRLGGQARGGFNRFLSGRIDEVRIYRRTLAPSEIQADMARGVASNDPPLVAYSYNEGAGSLAFDSSLHAATATLVNAGRATGKTGGALALNGASAYADTPASPVLSPSLEATFEAWINPAAAPSELAAILGRWNQSADDEYLLALSPARTLYFGWHTAGGGVWGTGSYNSFSGTTPVALSAWTHVAAVRSGATLTLYVNGQEDGSGDVMDLSPFRDGAADLRVGGQAAGNFSRFFAGAIDDVRIYGRALTAAEIQKDMATPVATARDLLPPKAPTGLHP